jgi:hypothetical protein
VSAWVRFAGFVHMDEDEVGVIEVEAVWAWMVSEKLFLS